jgi:MOSC domain-containing protein
MRERFGARLTVGCAGENLIAETAGRLQFDDVAGGLAIVAPDGRERVRLRVLEVAHPCRPFTGWALGGAVESNVLKEHLQFLEGGMRGFYCNAEGTGVVEVGDSLVAL